MPIGHAPDRTKGPAGASNKKCKHCGTRLVYGYVGSSTDVRFNTLICQNTKCRVSGQAQTESPKPPEDSSRVKILPLADTTHGSFIGKKSEPERDETKSADKKSMWDRLSLVSGRPKPTKYFCPTCCQFRMFMIVSDDKITVCPKCHGSFSPSNLKSETDRVMGVAS